MIQHNKSSPYHPQANSTVEEFKKILEKGLTNTVSTNRHDKDERVPATIWAYRTTIKILPTKTLFQLVYRREVVVPTKSILPSMFISEAMGMIDNLALRERPCQLMELDETQFLAKFHQSVAQRRQKSWNDKHIRKKYFEVGD